MTTDQTTERREICATHRIEMFMGAVVNRLICVGGLGMGGVYNGSCVPAVLVPVERREAEQAVIEAAEERWASGHNDRCPKRPCDCGHAALSEAIDLLAEASHVG